ncbi:MAG: TetR/AcrR family transcriptional regulator [Actinobacteria bacterium]|nr:TetR/AcrR family transcriptional regulator [Actinomycetota bacterium]
MSSEAGAKASDVAATTESPDGRRARAERNRDAVVEAILDLLREGVDRPSASEIAERSGVSVRSVFRHFDDLESLNIAAIEMHVRRVWPLFELDVPDGPLASRIAALVEQRASLFENIAPIRRVAERLRRTSPSIDRMLDKTRRYLRDQVKQCFQAELVTPKGSARDDLVDQLELVASWPAWNMMRTEQGLSVTKAKRVLASTLEALLRR